MSGRRGQGDKGGHTWNDRGYGGGQDGRHAEGRGISNHYGGGDTWNDRGYGGGQDGHHAQGGYSSRKRDGDPIELRTAAKKPSHTSVMGESLTPQAQPESWDKTAELKKAVEVTQARVLAKIAENKERGKRYANDSDSDCYTPVGVNQDAGDEIKDRLLTEYIRKLPGCHRMLSGFTIEVLNAGDDKICACPCSKYGIEVGEDVKCDYSNGTPDGLMAHLKKLGGVYDEKDKKSRQLVHVPLKCEYHYAANIFLREALANYNGSIGHKALYPVGTKEYIAAVAAADRKKQREKQTLVSENNELKSAAASKRSSSELLKQV